MSESLGELNVKGKGEIFVFELVAIRNDQSRLARAWLVQWSIVP